MKRAHRLTLAYGMAIISGCSDPRYGGMVIEQRTEPPLPVTVENDYIELQVGVAFMVKALPISSNDEPYTARDDMELSSANESVLRVYEADRITKVVLVGAGEGSTCMRVEVNGVDEDCITVEVTERDLESEESP